MSKIENTARKEPDKKEPKPPDRQESVRDQALRLAKHHLQLKGYNGFSFQTIADDLGIRKASLHYYFSSKEQMGIELLTDYKKSFELWTEKYSKYSAKEKLSEMIELFAKMSERDYKICPIGALCADFNSLSHKLQKQVKVFFEIERDWLQQTLEQGQKENYIRKDIDLPLAAEAVMAQMQGGLQIARLRNNSKGFRKLIKAAISILLVKK